MNLHLEIFPVITVLAVTTVIAGIKFFTNAKPLDDSYSATLAAIVCSLLFSTSANATNGYFMDGVGPKAQSMTGVGIALPQDSLAAATNPAGTALVGNRLDVGFTWFNPDRSARIKGNLAGADGNYNGNGVSAFVIPEIGYSREISTRWSYGIAVYGNGGMNTDYSTNPFAAFGASGDAGVDLSQLIVTPSLAFRPTPAHSLGIAATFAYQRFEANGLQPFDNAFVSAQPGKVTNNGHDSAHGWGLKLGWIGQLDENVTLGASWSSKIETGTFGEYAGLFADQGGFDIPASYGAGISWNASSALTLAADWQRIEYSDIGSVGNSLNLLFQGNPLGADGGPGFGWSDVEVIKFGAVYALNDTVTLRGGISHAGQAISGDQTFINILAPAVIKNHGSVGAEWRTGLGEWLISYTHAFEEKVAGSGSIPAAFGGGEADLTMSQSIIRFGWSSGF
ncbi:OmpP1/FadL family transporter [Microbulbifer pacificus]|uniref:Outer membrane protein transport protein n=1 Tax=Microbulbifer pacificus TaxID=407164 RepID=A0AAU0MXJ3_9GAMM|nr:outer membrane protein transport protein [Microbulbifer pacificus]WOX04736.1 outer membrane protein transport protein [Microbulbifer pacificus]